jgi:RNA recognition motif-containing protein
MSKRLYVGNLPRSADKLGLEKLFGQCGTVNSANVITDRVSGQSKGFGFVDMASDSEAMKAIGELNGSDYDGSSLIVNEAKPQRSQSGGAGARRQGPSRGRW